jgi:hypothetical protein
MTPSDLAFALHKAPQTIEHAVANLRGAMLPHLYRAHAPAVLICGAGPTLDLDRVRAAHAEGVSIWTVNTAARAVCSVVAPDVVVVRESLDVADHLTDLAHPPRLIALDLHAHPNVWRQAGSLGAFFVPASLQSFAIAAMLDVMPVYGGTASLTAAVAIAAAGGAEWIGLEGVDLAYARDGAGYASGARYAATLSRVDGTTATLVGADAQREIAEKSGQAPPTTRPNVHLVHARSGAPLHANGAWLSQIEWLEEFARRRPQADWWTHRSRGLGLAQLDGWPADERTWTDVYGAAALDDEALGFVADTRPVDPERLRLVLADIDRQAALAVTLADAIPNGHDPTLAGLIPGTVLVDTHAAGEIALAGVRGGGVADVVAGIYGAMRASAARVRA